MEREQRPSRSSAGGIVLAMRNSVTLLVLAAVLGMGCTSCGFFVPQTLTSIQVSPQNATVTPGGTTQLTATGVNSDGTNANLRNVAWSSSSTQIATVSSTGVVTGVSSGSATITATSTGISGTTTVTVGSGGGGTLTLAPANQTVSLAVGSVQFHATFNGQDVTASSTFTSSNTAVAQFTSTTGLATLVGQGTTTVTASFVSGGSTVTGTTQLTVGP
jgi:Bacterial Ig-like domain (group 2)